MMNTALFDGAKFWWRRWCTVILCAGAIGVSTIHSAMGADFSVTTPGSQFAFRINGANGPTLTLIRGHTYTFSIGTSGIHPFHIESPGVVNNNISSGTITYTVPNTAANHYYNCVVHGDLMRGEIITTNAPPLPPPDIKILGLAVGTNIVVTSTGTNTWSVIPEYTTNVVSGNWFGLTVQSNRYSPGTNETWCGKPPGDPVFIRIRSQPN